MCQVVLRRKSNRTPAGTCIQLHGSSVFFQETGASVLIDQSTSTLGYSTVVDSDKDPEGWCTRVKQSSRPGCLNGHFRSGPAWELLLLEKVIFTACAFYVFWYFYTWHCHDFLSATFFPQLRCDGFLHVGWADSRGFWRLLVYTICGSFWRAWKVLKGFRSL